MAKDIVTRLRDATLIDYFRDHEPVDINALLTEAAAEIVRLRAGTIRNSHK
jgi:hypothetical protein